MNKLGALAMDCFKKGQKYAAKRVGEEWQYVAGLARGAEIIVAFEEHSEKVIYEGIVPRNRKYPLTVSINGRVSSMEISSVVSPGNREQVRKTYLECLQGVADGKYVEVVPGLECGVFRECEDVLADHLCDAIKIPRGSTIGHSVRERERRASTASAI